MFVAIHHPTNDGTYVAIIDGPGFDSGTELADGYEVDAHVRSFATVEEAEAWVVDTGSDVDINDMATVTGGRVLTY